MCYYLHELGKADARAWTGIAKFYGSSLPSTTPTDILANHTNEHPRRPRPRDDLANPPKDPVSKREQLVTAAESRPPFVCIGVHGGSDPTAYGFTYGSKELHEIQKRAREASPGGWVDARKSKQNLEPEPFKSVREYLAPGSQLDSVENEHTSTLGYMNREARFESVSESFGKPRIDIAGPRYARETKQRPQTLMPYVFVLRTSHGLF